MLWDIWVYVTLLLDAHVVIITLGDSYDCSHQQVQLSVVEALGTSRVSISKLVIHLAVH